MKNLKLFLSALAVWFTLSILIILFIKDTIIMNICFIIISLILLITIYRVLYIEFFHKYNTKRKNNQNNSSNKNL